MTRAAFYAQFPEFGALESSSVGQALLDAMLAAALLEINLERWGAMASQGQAYLAAHKLAVSPWGNSVKLSPGDGTSPYGNEYKRMQAAIGIGGLVL